MTLESRLSEQLDTSLQSLTKSVDRLVLAFSGGLDSCVLLQLLSIRPQNFNLLLWHINHGLLDNASEMEDFCNRLAQQYNIEFKVSHLHLRSQQNNLEAIARKARYAVFEQALSHTDCLLTAHHANDQVETFLLNTLRGSGSAGLRGIARYRPLKTTYLLRPLLDVSRTDLMQYAEQTGLGWFEDPSNESDRFDRNYLRNQIVPLIKQRWPGYLDSIKTVCQIQSETQQLLNEFAADDYRRCQQATSSGNINLDQPKLALFSNARQKNVVRFWLKEQGYESLTRGKLVELIRQLAANSESTAVIHSSNYDIRVYQKQLYIAPHREPLTLLPIYDLNKSDSLVIADINLRVSREQIFKHFGQQDSNQPVSIRFRAQQLSSGASRHRLKRLFQKYQIPPWLRAQTPQIFIDDQLVGLWLE